MVEDADGDEDEQEVDNSGTMPRWRRERFEELAEKFPVRRSKANDAHDDAMAQRRLSKAKQLKQRAKKGSSSSAGAGSSADGAKSV